MKKLIFLAHFCLGTYNQFTVCHSDKELQWDSSLLFIHTTVLCEQTKADCKVICTSGDFHSLLCLFLCLSVSITVAMKAHPRWDLLENAHMFYTGAALMALGSVFVISSFMALGVTGTFLGKSSTHAPVPHTHLHTHGGKSPSPAFRWNLIHCSLISYITFIIESDSSCDYA